MAYYKCGSIHPTQNSNVVVDNVSGAIANFNTPLAMPLIETKFGVKATQDLNGQSGPYPAGGGINKWDEENVNGYISSTDGSFISHDTSICSKNFNPILPNTNYYPYKGSNVPTSYICWYDSNKDYISRDPLAGQVVTTPNNAAYFKVSSYGYGATYNNDISINYPATDTAYHPYSNICPINGVSEVSVFHCHKNLYQYDASKATTGTTYVGTTHSYLPLGLKGACTLTFSASLKEGQEPTVQFINIGKMVNGIITPLQALIQAGTIFTRTIPFNAGEEIVLVSASEQVFAITSSLPRYDIQIEVSSQATSYEAYNGTTTLINLGGTYYGGEFTQDKNGKRKFVVTHELIDLGSRTWAVHQNGFYYNSFGDLIKRCEPSVVADLLAQKYQVKTAQYVYGHGSEVGLIGLNSNLMYVTDSATPSGLLVYPINEPFTVALPDGEPIKSFPGINNIFCDTGDTSLQFRKIQSAS